jgi:hypothetical protein
MGHYKMGTFHLIPWCKMVHNPFPFSLVNSFKWALLSFYCAYLVHSVLINHPFYKSLYNPF